MYPVLAVGCWPAPLIYGLVDPREPARIRYVGQTLADPAARLAQHLREREWTRHPQSRKVQWILALAAEGVHPAMVLIERVDSAEQLDRREAHWFVTLRERGEADTNGSLPARVQIRRTAKKRGGACKPHPTSALVATRGESAFGFDLLCSRCDLEYHLPDDDLGPACRAEIDVAFADLPGARA